MSVINQNSSTLNSKEKILGVRKNVFYLSLVSLLNDFSSEMIYSVMPAFLTKVIGAPLWFVGFLEGSADALNNVLKIFSGSLADYFDKRKPIIVLGYFISSLSRFFLFLVNLPIQVFGLRIVDRVGKGLRDAPRDALIYLSVDKEELNKSYNFQRAFDTLGAILGPLIGFILLNYFLNLNYRSLFLIGSFLGFLALIHFIFVKDVRIKDRKSDSNQKSVFSLKLIWQSPLKIKFYLLSFFIFSLGYFPISLVLLRTQTLDPSLKFFSLFYFIYNFFFVVFALPVGKLADQIGERRTLIYGFLVALTAYLLFSLSNDSFIFLGLILLSFSLALIDGIKMVYIGKMVEEDKLATYQGMLNALYGFGQLFGGLIGGLIWTKIGFTFAFLFGGFFIILALILFLMIK